MEDNNVVSFTCGSDLNFTRCKLTMESYNGELLLNETQSGTFSDDEGTQGLHSHFEF